MNPTPVTTWRYHLPSVNCEGWAVAFLDSIGCFAVLSDYGDYGHRWPQNGWGPGGFRDFFLQCGDDYVLRKIAPRKCYDGDATFREVKRRICDLRRHGSWSRDRAREEWDLLLGSEGLYSREDFSVWYQRTQIDEAYDLAVYDVEPQAKGFVTFCLPRLREAIRAELERERTELGETS